MRKHCGIRFDTDAFQKISKTDALNCLTTTLVLKRVFGPEINNVVRQTDYFCKVIVLFEFHERDDHYPQ